MFVTADNLLKSPLSQKWSKLTFGCASLDKCTNGGIITRGITEICGEAGSGKSQILMQLCLTVQLPKKYGGFEKKAAIIYTEGQFPSNRLIQMANFVAKKYLIKVEDLVDGIFIHYVMYADKLMECLSNELMKVLENNEIGLIIIDSIGSIFRTESAYIDRAKNLRLLRQTFLKITEKYNCAIVCSNQVTSFDNSLIPCLGLAWSHQVRTRLKIEKIDSKSESSKTVRKLKVIYSPEIDNKNTCTFSITHDGVTDND